MAEIRFTETEDVLGFDIIDDGEAKKPTIQRRKPGAPRKKRTAEQTAKRKAVVRREIGNAKGNLEVAGDIFKLSAKDLIKRFQSRGLSEEQIINVMLDDFDNNGPLFGRLKNMFGSASDDALGNVENESVAQGFEEQGFSNIETWIAVLVNTCVDCFPRHGRTRSHEEWEQLGLPRSGFSVCRQRCQCKLIPQEISDSFEELRSPLNRARGNLLKVAREKRKAGRIRNVNRYVNRKLGKINSNEDPITSKLRRRRKPVTKKFIKKEFID